MEQDLLDQEITPSTTLQLGKKTYTLAFSMASVLAFKQKTGRNMFTPEGWAGLNLHADPEAMIAFFWASLQTFHPEISFEQATRMANFKNMRLINRKCDECLSAYLPDKDDEDAGETQPATVAQSAGSTSGQ